MKTPKPAATPPATALLTDLRGLINAARSHVAQTANATLTLLYWHIGQRIGREVLGNKRAEYGEEIVSTLSTQLAQDYGSGFGAKNLARMVQFAEVFPEENIVVTLSRQLSWSHFVALLPLKRPFERDYYAELCRIERWSVRTLPARTYSPANKQRARPCRHCRRCRVIANNKNAALVRSSAAEYLTFVAATGSGQTSVEMRYEDENVWLTQKMMATLYDVDVRTINEHIKNIFKSNELEEDTVIRKFRITASDGKNYNLQDAGKVSAELAKQHAESEFEKYRIVQDRLFQSDFDRLLQQTAPSRKTGETDT